MRQGAAGTLVKANGITQTTSRTTTTNAQVERYAVITETMDLIKEKVEVNILMNLCDLKQSFFFTIFISEFTKQFLLGERKTLMKTI